MARRKPLYHGWIIVAAAFGVMFTGFGVAYSFAAFFPSLESEFNASRADVSLVFSISGLLYFFVGAASGPLADRVGARWVISSGMVLIGLGLLVTSFAQSLWQVTIAYGLGIGVGVGLAYVPSLGAVQHWFVRRRGQASGYAVSGIGVGTLVGPPVAALLIEAFDWRGAYLVLGGFAAIVGTALAAAIEDSPARRGLLPDGDEARPHAPADPQSEPAASLGLSLGEAVRTRAFMALCAGCLLAGFGIFIPFVHLAAYANDHGLSQQTGVLMVSFLGLGSLLGRFFIGAPSDRIGRRRSFAVMLGGMAAMLVWWTLSEAAWSLALFGVLFGAAYGGFVALSAALVADYFGGRNVSGLIGFVYSAVGVGTFVGPLAAGYAFDVTGSYVVPILIAAAASAVAMTIILLLHEPPARPR